MLDAFNVTVNCIVAVLVIVCCIVNLVINVPKLLQARKKACILFWILMFLSLAFIATGCLISEI